MNMCISSMSTPLTSASLSSPLPHQTSQQLPQQCGFFMPAEWQKHRATWLAWPRDEVTFPKRVAKVEQVFATMIYHLHQAENIELLVLHEDMQRHATEMLRQQRVDVSKVRMHITDYADVWIRDYGPTFLLQQRNSNASACAISAPPSVSLLSCSSPCAWIKWQYNAYGAKFPDLLKDDQVPHQIRAHLDRLSHCEQSVVEFESGFIMEGGAIDVNGAGTVITTAECLLNPNRHNNQHMDNEQIETRLKAYLGVQKIIWLDKGLLNDHTDGHVDEVARFVAENVIVCAYAEADDDPNFAVLAENWRVLKQARDQKGRQFDVVKLPLPSMCYDTGEVAPVSYTNFYIANSVVLVPQFQHANDATALSILQRLFPTRQAIGIDCTDLIYGGGAIHCVTQQQPEDFRVSNC